MLFLQKGKNHLIINIVSEGRGELALHSNFFVWGCGLVFTAVEDVPPKGVYYSGSGF